MAYTVTQEDVLSVSADAAVFAVEMTMSPVDSPACERLTAAGGEALREGLRRQRFLSVGSAAALDAGELPFRSLILTAIPRWLTGKANELLALRRCYESVYEQARLLGCRSVAMPFLSANYYRFPREKAVHTALNIAGKQDLETVFVAETPELYEQSLRPYRKPKIVSYVGYYRDHAIFELDNGLFARVDLRPENVDASEIPYFEACYRAGNNPLQPPLPEKEIARLRAIYEENEW